MAKRIYFTGQWSPTESVHTWPPQMMRMMTDQFYGRDVTIVATGDTRLRTKAQNGYWMGTFIPALAEILHHGLGWEWIHPEHAGHRLRLHYDFLEVVWGKDARYIIEADGTMSVEYLDARVSSSALKVDDFSRMMERAHQWVIQYTGARIPLPGEGGEIVYF